MGIYLNCHPGIKHQGKLFHSQQYTDIRHEMICFAQVPLPQFKRKAQRCGAGRGGGSSTGTCSRHRGDAGSRHSTGPAHCVHDKTVALSGKQTQFSRFLLWKSRAQAGGRPHFAALVALGRYSQNRPALPNPLPAQRLPN